MMITMIATLSVCAVPATQQVTITPEFLYALAMVESGGNTRAVGDGGRAVGIMQIWPIYVREANRILGEQRYTDQDRWNLVKALQMTKIVLEYWGRYHSRHGHKIGPIELCSLHRHPCAAWSPQYMEAKIDRGRTAKLKYYMRQVQIK